MDPADDTLRRAIREEAYRVPVRLTIEHLHARLSAGERRRRGSWLTAGAAAAVVATVAAGVIAIGALTPPPPHGAGASATTVETTVCPVSDSRRHGSWWVEIGGPSAYFNVEPGSLTASGPNAWLLITRFDPDAPPGEEVSMFAERLGSGDRVDGRFNSPMNPAGIHRRDMPAPSLPGGWYLFEQPIPTTGCWRLSAAIDGRVVGTAVIDVQYGPRPDPADSAATPQVAPDPELHD